MTAGPPGIVLAAGLGTRMRSQTPKVLHPVAGKPLLAHVLDAVRAAGARPVVVLSKESEAGRTVAGERRCRRDAGSAARHRRRRSCRARCDLPDLGRGVHRLQRHAAAAREHAACARGPARARRGARAPLRQGRHRQRVRACRPRRERRRRARRRGAPRDRRRERLPESNLGAYAVDLAWLRKAVPRLRANETGEIFLTDLVALAVADGHRSPPTAPMIPTRAWA